MLAAIHREQAVAEATAEQTSGPGRAPDAGAGWGHRATAPSAGSDNAPDGGGRQPSYSWRPPKPFQSVPVSHGRMGAMAAAALWECSDSNSELAASLAGDLWRHLMGHFGSLGPFPGKPLLAVLGLLDDSRGPDTVCGRVSQKNGRSWASKK